MGLLWIGLKSIIMHHLDYKIYLIILLQILYGLFTRTRNWLVVAFDLFGFEVGERSRLRLPLDFWPLEFFLWKKRPESEIKLPLSHEVALEEWSQIKDHWSECMWSIWIIALGNYNEESRWHFVVISRDSFSWNLFLGAPRLLNF